MKTAVSLKNELFERAEKTAKRLKLSRSDPSSRCLRAERQAALGGRPEDARECVLRERSGGASGKISLGEEGMNAEMIGATSRGEMDATGDDEASWREDRRVDVRLASEL